MFRIIQLILALSALTHTTNAQQPSLGLKDFLRELHDISSLPAYAPGTYSAQVSSYDRTGMNDDGFSGKYSFIRRNPDSSLVIFDVKGAGVINRIWTPTPTKDSLDFYIDSDSISSFTICYQDLFSGKVYPFVAPLCANQLGGYYCYMPIPFNKSCKIIFRGKKTMFHQIGYRLYPAATRIDKFGLPLSKIEEQALSAIRLLWKNSSPAVKDLYTADQKIQVATKKINMRPGQTVSVFEAKQGGRILGFDITFSVAPEKISKDVDLKITWDDERSPAVYCPLGDYFGYAFGKPSMKSLLIGSDGQRNFSYFPMPFDKSAKIELVYRKREGNDGADAAIQCNVYTNPEKRNISREGKFYTYWTRNNPVGTGQPHVMLMAQGKGHLAGSVLQAQGLKAGMTIFFEGDDSTVVDGELRMHGTGSEDFFNGGWYALMDRWDAAMSLPLSGALEYSLPLCRTGGYRLFLPDKISFERSIFHAIEHGPEHNSFPSDYTSVSYYYGDRPVQQPNLPNAANTSIYYPDTLSLYPQLMNMGIDGDITIETKWAFPTGGLTFYYSIKENSVLRISLQGVPAGNYRVFLDHIKAPEAAMFSVWQRQTQLSEWMDNYSNQVERLEMQEISDFDVTPLNNTISFRFKTSNGRNRFILNRVVLVKKK